MKTERKLIQQAYYVPEQDRFYKSADVHDFVTIDLGDKSVFIDGGAEYQRRGGDLALFDSGRLVSFCLYTDTPFEEVASKFLWGTYGPGRKGPFRWVLLSERPLDHLEAIQKTQLHVRGNLVGRIVDYWVDKKREKK